MPAKKKAVASEPTPSFEAALEELDELTDRLSHEPESLSNMIDDYERGQYLIKICDAQLQTARERITLIQAQLQETDRDATPSKSSSASDENNDVRLF
ncbi:exodeoxyribonuclease VII small subunit [Akkermansiaceae bacterium]|nr:exodeoxyribonuclease VII small subunit [Akkermansiaceae bacterium]MDB4541587.1 exodeoxyribonuclease VII small subunit [Akkermansiaceae bacterium]